MTSEFNEGKYAPRYVPDEKYKPKPAPKGKPEKVWGFTVASFLGLMGIFVLKYLLDFLLLPKLFPDLYPLSVGAILVWLASTLIVSFLALKFVTRIGFFYEIADLFYVLLVLIWPLGLYGTGLIPAFFVALIGWIVMRAIQWVMLWIFILVGFVRM